MQKICEINVKMITVFWNLMDKETIHTGRLNRSSAFLRCVVTATLRLRNLILAEFADAYTDMFYRFYLGSLVNVPVPSGSGFMCRLMEKKIT